MVENFFNDMAIDSPNKKIIHWTGPVGKQHIRENLM